MTNEREREREREMNDHNSSVGKPEEKITLERPRLRWVDNIKICLNEIRAGYSYR
jgi:hypothetical protein